MNVRNGLILLLLLIGIQMNGQVTTYEKFADFESKHLTHLSEDTVYVINFWATWCAPCVAELPIFESFNEKYQDKNIKTILVTLDSPKTMETRVLPFIAKNKLKSEVVLLADGKTNQWIDLVDESWSGAIPITLILRGDTRHFYEKEYSSLEALEIDVFKLYN